MGSQIVLLIHCFDSAFNGYAKMLRFGMILGSHF
nr:MAG TPA: hypothetical protein [Caudoviricetes sp.]